MVSTNSGVGTHCRCEFTVSVRQLQRKETAMAVKSGFSSVVVTGHLTVMLLVVVIYKATVQALHTRLNTQMWRDNLDDWVALRSSDTTMASSGIFKYNRFAVLPFFCCNNTLLDVIMTTIASLITSLAVVYSAVYSDADQRKHQSSASRAFVWGIHRDRWIPRTKGQLRGKCFHLMTSSWVINIMTASLHISIWNIDQSMMHKSLLRQSKLYNIFSVSKQCHDIHCTEALKNHLSIINIVIISPN